MLSFHTTSCCVSRGKGEFEFAAHDWDVEGVGDFRVAHMGAPPSGSAKSEGSEGTMNDGDGDGRSQLLHDTGLDLEWSASEQSILNDGLAK